MCKDVLVYFIGFMCRKEFVWELSKNFLSLDSILYLRMYFWLRVWVAYSIFVRETSDLSLRFLDPCLIRHYIHFYVTYVHVLIQVDHHSLSYLFTFFYLYSITLFCSTSFDFFLLSSRLMFDLGSMSIYYSCLFDMFIPLTSFFMWEPPGPWLVRFSMHCISCMRGMGIISLGLLSLVSSLFLLPYYLSQRYVLCLKTILRPWLHTLYLTAHTWAILKIGGRLLLGAWWMRTYDMIYNGAYLTHRWKIFWDDTLH